MQQIKIVDREYTSEGYEFKDAFEKRLNDYLSDGWKLFSVIPSSENIWDPTFILIKEVIGCVEKEKELSCGKAQATSKAYVSLREDPTKEVKISDVGKASVLRTRTTPNSQGDV